MSLKAQSVHSSRVRREEVAALVREQIIAGRYGPGERLPSREAMAEAMGAGYVTVQKGLTQLGDEGFVVSIHGDGTYVAKHLPHLSHYGMLVVKSQDEVLSTWQSRFHRVMVEEAQRFTRANEQGQRITAWYDPFDQPERPGYHDLVDALEGRRLAGLIFLDHPHVSYYDTPLIKSPWVGKVTAGQGKGKPVAGLQCICPNDKAFLVKAMKLVQERGRRRVAVLTTAGAFENPGVDYRRLTASLASEHGLVTKPHWTMPVHPHMDLGVTTTVRLLFDLPRAQWPDALIITDDHMVEAAAQGLYEAGVDTSRDVTVVGFCNFPDRPPAVLPIVRLGLDCRELLMRMVASIHHQQTGRRPGAVQWVGPVTEEEFVARYNAG